MPGQPPARPTPRERERSCSCSGASIVKSTGSFPLGLTSRSKLKPSHQLPLPCRAECRAVVEVPETGRVLACGLVDRRSCQRVCRCRIAHFRAVEDIGELGSNLKARSLFDPEDPSDAEVLHRPALITEVAIVGRRRAPLSRRRVRPCRRIEREVLVRIEAVAIEVLREQRNTRNAVEQRALE